ncbi:nucleotidyl transferase AbiEii/AbiGii toxin family protein [Asinibacterium sp. OR53]|uniref:nucleotidyl transferase AbiEii/AbiGii toxin family protein n=1 Tax=Asinibacterium sp. OR53 TaxID=925409 RepID=UPI0004787501|nr:nucleotidyl transferase AbiEii/AbiGii toxin family protein [Asinibacterium sp. OR53]
MNLNDVKEGELKEVFDALEEVFKHLNIDYYLIGAIARDIWYARGNKEFRKTKDVDFAAMVGSKAEYETVRQYLKDHKHFQETKANSFVMITLGGVQVDILPFGEIEIDDSIQLEGAGLTSIKVNGFKEVYDTGTQEVIMETGHTFQVATLPSIVLLKLIAFDDRPDQRLKDSRDIANIINHFFDLHSDLIYSDENLDLFMTDEATFNEQSLQEIAAIVIGREIRKIIRLNNPLLERVNLILEKQIQLQGDSAFVRNMSQETNMNVIQVMKWLTNLAKGISQEIQ